MNATVFEILRDVLLPIITLVLGWVFNAYRNKQQKEKSVLDNVQQILDMKTREVQRAQAEVDRAHEINDRQEAVVQRLEAKLDKKDKAIRKGRHCDWVRTGHDCPITEAEEHFQPQEIPCSSCDINENVKKND